MSGLGQRLRDARGQESRDAAAGRLGVHPNTLAKYETEARVPDAELLLRACEIYGVEEAWLLSGRGEMRPGSADRLIQRAYGVGGSSSRHAETPAPEGYELVAAYDIAASSGHGAYPAAEEEEKEPLAFPRALLRRLASAGVDKLVVVFNRGESNEPDIFDGDAMLVDRGVERLADDAFYVFRHDDALMVKLIERLLDGRVALKARNPGYREEILSKEEAARLTIFGRVVWRGGLV
jgi:phage repressor protein C with HTH and peptisase S24 domain